MRQMTSSPRVAILGSTGSVGSQAVDALSLMGCRIVLLSAGRNVELLARQARAVKPLVCTVETESAAMELRAALSDMNVKVYGGPDAVLSASAMRTGR